VIIASFTAIFGISAWKHEFKGKRDIELAEDILDLFYRAERAIETIRCSQYDLRHGQKREKEEKETPEQKQARDRANVIFMKIKEHGDIFDQLYAKRFRFMTRFGKDKEKPFDDLRRIVHEIWVSAQQLTELWERQFQGKILSDEDQKFIKEFQEIIWNGGKQDPIEPRLVDIVKSIEKTCRPIIDGNSSCFSIIFYKTKKCVISGWQWLKDKV